MSLTTPESSNIASIPFVAMALQTQEQINAAYMRKMNKGYASYISNPPRTSPDSIPHVFIEKIAIEQEPS